MFAAVWHAKSRSSLMLTYGTGLRLSELCGLRVADIDSAADRMCISVVHSKRAKGRYWPVAGAPSIDFIATLLTAGAHRQRPLWSRQIEKSYDSCQSEAVAQLSQMAGSSAAVGPSH